MNRRRLYPSKILRYAAVEVFIFHMRLRRPPPPAAVGFPSETWPWSGNPCDREGTQMGCKPKISFHYRVLRLYSVKKKM